MRSFHEVGRKQTQVSMNFGNFSQISRNKIEIECDFYPEVFEAEGVQIGTNFQRKQSLILGVLLSKFRVKSKTTAGFDSKTNRFSLSQFLLQSLTNLPVFMVPKHGTP